MSVDVCLFPGCADPVSTAGRSEGGGRRARYCGDSSHNRQAAYAMRKRSQAGATAAQEASDRAVSAAGGTLRQVVGVIAPMLTAHQQALDEQVQVAVAALADLDDLTKLDTELAAIKAAADRRVVNAQLETGEATQASEVALAAQLEAQTGEQLARQSEQLALVAAEQVRAELKVVTGDRDQMQAQRDEAVTDVQAARDEILELRVKIAEAAAAAQASGLAAQLADERSQAMILRCDEQVAHAEQRADAAHTQVREVEVLLAQARVELEGQ